MSPQRFDDFVQKAFWTLLLAVSAWIGSEIRLAGRSIAELNTQMKTVIGVIADHETRLREIEKIKR